MADAPSLEKIVELLDHRLDSVVGGNEIRLQKEYGLDLLVEPYIQAFPMIRNYSGRMQILFWLTRYARLNQDVVHLALGALTDPSRIVRHHACGAVAYAGCRAALPVLRDLLSHTNQKTRADAKAAIEAIEEANHHLFIDRNHSGKHFWVVNPEDDS